MAVDHIGVVPERLLTLPHPVKGVRATPCQLCQCSTRRQFGITCQVRQRSGKAAGLSQFSVCWRAMAVEVPVRICPSCETPVTSTPGYPTWCAGCEWGLDEPAEPTRKGFLRARLDARSARLVEDLC